MKNAYKMALAAAFAALSMSASAQMFGAPAVAKGVVGVSTNAPMWHQSSRFEPGNPVGPLLVVQNHADGLPVQSPPHWPLLAPVQSQHLTSRGIRLYRSEDLTDSRKMPSGECVPGPLILCLDPHSIMRQSSAGSKSDGPNAGEPARTKTMGEIIKDYHKQYDDLVKSLEPQKPMPTPAPEPKK
jgi:hypothetical protein